MKKISLFIVLLFTITTLVTACGGSRGGAGCPTPNKSKPFRA